MKYKNFFFAIFVSIIFTSEICSMLIPAAKRLYRSHRKQTREFLEIIPPIIILGGMALVGANILSIQGGWGPLWHPSAEAKIIMQARTNLYQNNNRSLYDEVAIVGSKDCSNAYTKKEKCKNNICCRNVYPEDCNDMVQQDAHRKRAEIFNGIKEDKHSFLLRLKDSIKQLHAKELALQLSLIEGKINHQDHKEIVKLIAHKKDCCYKQYVLFEEMQNEDTVILLIELRTIVDEEKKQRDKEFCEKIKTISIITKKSLGGQIERNNYNRCSKINDDSQYNRSDDSHRDGNRSLDGFNNVLGPVIAAKMMYDAMDRNHEYMDERSSTTTNSDYSSLSSHASNTESNSSSDNSDLSSY